MGVYLDVLHEIAMSGTTFKDKNALITGVGKGSIGVEILKGLMSGGAHIVVTTSHYSRTTVDVIPFAAVPENGRENDGLDDKSELAHRIMLMNLLRLLGAIKVKKASRRIVTRPTQVVLPLSPNHGLFGKDGLYSESKVSLETLFSRWSSESWGEYLCLVGAVIG